MRRFVGIECHKMIADLMCKFLSRKKGTKFSNPSVS